MFVDAKFDIGAIVERATDSGKRMAVRSARSAIINELSIAMSINNTNESHLSVYQALRLVVTSREWRCYPAKRRTTQTPLTTPRIPRVPCQVAVRLITGLRVPADQDVVPLPAIHRYTAW